ncbi:DUF952 domain-containing protein [Micromonospora zingiberis]|uniref:DUF952 domain-containing protein n=1 Tax=Micromonospora zingiberis TaxID=2053011 RepID=A0A4R0GLE9_9ACTN|nr:DUF952 domain-containing protein [Micromonospora zingiberis]TCB98474.1 DUF952 domain-containing protein [Micromonospora zingiberis]
MLVYKILLPSEWAELQAVGRFDGSPLDRDSGFIHCSSRAQLPATAARFFGDQPRLVVVALDATRLGDAVRWEDASNGERFPHLYAALPAEAVVGVHHLAGAARIDQEIPWSIQ